MHGTPEYSHRMESLDEIREGLFRSSKVYAKRKELRGPNEC